MDIHQSHAWNRVARINSDFFYYVSCNAVLFLVLIICSINLKELMKNTKLAEKAAAWGSRDTYGITKAVTMILLLMVSFAFLVGDSYNPFLYFRF